MYGGEAVPYFVSLIEELWLGVAGGLHPGDNPGGTCHKLYFEVYYS
jgi:hypothetical protein